MLNNRSIIDIMQATDTKEMILEKTFQLLLQKGYDGVSISDIQKATKMSRGILYHYFGSKESLFVEVTQKYFVNLFRIDLLQIQEFGVPEMIVYITEKYTNICTNTLGETPGNKQSSIMNYDFLFYRVMQENEDFARKYMQIRDDEIRSWEIVLTNSSKRGELRRNVDISKMAKYFIYLMDGVWMNAVNQNQTNTLIGDFCEVLQDFYLLLTNK